MLLSDQTLSDTQPCTFQTHADVYYISPVVLVQVQVLVLDLSGPTSLQFAAVPSPIEKVYMPSVRWGARKYCKAR